MALDRFQNLSAAERALVSIAVLLDGREAGTYLHNSGAIERRIKDGADDLARITPELRMPLLGTLLRTALKELREENKRGT